MFNNKKIKELEDGMEILTKEYKKSEEKNKKLEQKLDDSYLFPYKLDELKRSFDKETADFLRELVKNENAWKFLKQQKMNEAMTALGAKGDADIARIDGVIKGLLRWIEAGVRTLNDPKDQKIVADLQERYR